MRLASLQLTAQGATGWKSPVLQFGHRTTSLYAKNGSGKTPLVHALAFCLGYPIIFSPMTVPSSMLKAANSGVVPWR